MSCRDYKMRIQVTFMQVTFFEHENNKHANIADIDILTIVIDLLEFSSFAV
jgi:hypothetical protein